MPVLLMQVDDGSDRILFRDPHAIPTGGWLVIICVVAFIVWGAAKHTH